MKKHKKLLALLLGVLLLSQLAVYYIQDTGSSPSYAAAQQVSTDDKQTASEISNLTGASIETILNMRILGYSWNQILEFYRNNQTRDSGNIEQRMTALTQTGVSEHVSESLMKEGYSNEEIVEAKLVVERLQYQLTEVSETEETQVEKPGVEAVLEQNNDNLQKMYQQIAESFQLDKALLLSVKLKKELDGIEAVLDEYLLSLRLELDLEMYLSDKEQYLKLKEEKSWSLVNKSEITMATIEQALLKKIQKKNTAESNTSPGGITEKSSVLPETKSPLPDVPKPKVEDIKPVNPNEAIMQEIRMIEPNHL